MLPVSDYPKNKKYATDQDYYKMTTKRHYSFVMEVLTIFFFSEYGTGAVLHVTFFRGKESRRIYGTTKWSGVWSCCGVLRITFKLKYL